MWWSDLGCGVVLTKISKSFNHCVQEVRDKHRGPHLVRIIILSLIWWWFCVKMSIVCVHCPEEGSIVSVHCQEEGCVGPSDFPRAGILCPSAISRAEERKIPSQGKPHLTVRLQLWLCWWWRYRHAMPDHIRLDSSSKLLHQGCLSKYQTWVKVKLKSSAASVYIKVELIWKVHVGGTKIMHMNNKFAYTLAVFNNHIWLLCLSWNTDTCK